MKLDFFLKVIFSQFCCGCKPISQQPQPVDPPCPLQPQPSIQNPIHSQKQLQQPEEDQKQNQENSSVPDPQQTSTKKNLPLLKLHLLEGPEGFNSQILVINSSGLEGSLRKANDGITKFGSLNIQDKPPTNDFIVDYQNQKGKSYFLIESSSDKKVYNIRDLGNGSGTFVKIQGELQLKNNFIISFGDSHMMIRYSSDYQNSHILSLNFLEGPKQNQQYTFEPGDEVVFIGRMIDCRIRFDDSKLSRYHCRIEHRQFGWVLIDGDQQRKSMNGTWLFVEDQYEIFDQMMFKAGNYLFKCKIGNDLSVM